MELHELHELLLGRSQISFTQLATFIWSLKNNLVNEVLAAPRDSAARSAAKLKTISLLRENMWIPTMLTILYVVFVHTGPHFMRKRRPWPLRYVLAGWNLVLTVFSAVGVVHCASCLVANAVMYGWRYTICTHPSEIALQGTDMDVWTCYFVLSKLAEFGDTILKVAMKKPITFLHWFHHAMTAWVGWLSLSSAFAPGMWYSTINFGVHTPMYIYYFLSALLPKASFKRYVAPFASIITAGQIIQMCGFLLINGTAYYFLSQDAVCHVQPLNLITNAIVVGIYLLLFVLFFIKKYMPKQQHVD